MSTTQWKSQFANDPRQHFDLYLELLNGTEPQGKIERAADGELYLSLFACPHVKVPLRWLLELAERAESLPVPGSDDTA
jgi:hypothetical protein